MFPSALWCIPQTGYKIFQRYKASGLEALNDWSRRPIRYTNQLPNQIESFILACQQEKPHRGARTIRELLVRRLDQDIRVPGISTIRAVMPNPSCLNIDSLLALTVTLLLRKPGFLHRLPLSIHVGKTTVL